MKTTLDLPNALIKKMKLRATQEGRKLKEVARDALMAGLAGPSSLRRKPPIIKKDKLTGLPVIQTPRGAALTSEQISDILLAQEIEWANDSGR